MKRHRQSGSGVKPAPEAPFGVPRRYLLLVAGFVWTFAGGMLLGRGGSWLLAFGDHLAIRFAIALTGGLVFFFALFRRISRRHVERIKRLDAERPSAFSFFNPRSYVMMATMIAGGVLLRRSGLVAPSILYTFYVCMGTPLLISAFRFFRSFAVYGRGAPEPEPRGVAPRPSPRI
jgi:hypothetical protein